MNKRIAFTVVLFLLMASTGLASLTDGLAAYYPFDGDARDLSGYANHGTVYGAQLTEDRFGRADHAYLFDGQTDKIEAPHSASLDITGPITLSAWIRTNETYWYSSIIAKKVEPDPAIGYDLCTFNGKAATGLLYTSGHTHNGGIVFSDTLVVDGQWHLLTSTYDGSEMRMYVDGQLDGSLAYSDGYESNTEPLKIGYYYYPYNDGQEGSHNRALNGAIDEVRIYNRALAQSEITELYNEESEFPPLPPTVGLVAHYKLDGTSGAVVDETGNYDGVNFGATRGVTGKVGNAFYFDESDYVSTDLIPSIYATASLWIYPEGPGLGLPHGGFLGTGITTDGGKDCWSLSWSSDTEAVAIAFYEGNSVNGSIPVSNPGSVPLGVFSHIAVVVNDTNTSLYINGELSGTGTLLSSQDRHDRGLLIGRHYVTGGGASTMRGKIDEVRIYNRALTQFEITELYNEGSEPPCPPLPSHEPWSFVHMTDTHFGWLLEDISDLINPFQILSCIANMDPKPDFILLTGDIGHFGCADDSKCIGSSSYWSPYRAYHSFVKLANNYGIDVYPVPGNHDRMEFPSLPFPSWFSDDCDNGLSCYNVQVTSLTNYDFEDEEHEGLLFIGLDSGSGYPPGEGLSTVQIDYIEDLGSKYPCTPKIVFMHHPGLDPEDLDIGTNQPKFLEWCKSNKVELVLAGHSHQDHT